DRFAALIPPDGFERIEASVPNLASPNHSFRQALIGILWRFYHRAREADAMVNRATLKGELQNALAHVANLKTSVESLAKSLEPPVIDALSPFAGMLDERDAHPAGQHPTGIGLIVVLDKFERGLKRAGLSLPHDRGGPRRAAALALLTHELSQWQRRWSDDHTHGKWFDFLKAIVDVLREMEPALQKAERKLGLVPPRFKLPNGPDALRRGLYPRAPRKTPSRRKTQ